MRSFFIDINNLYFGIIYLYCLG